MRSNNIKGNNPALKDGRKFFRSPPIKLFPSFYENPAGTLPSSLERGELALNTKRILIKKTWI